MVLNTENWENCGGMFIHSDDNGKLLATVYLSKDGWVAEIEEESWGYEGFADNFSAMAWADNYLIQSEREKEIKREIQVFEDFLNRNDKRFGIDY